MENHPLEEKYPLLLLYVEENGKKSDFPQRVVFADKGRGKEVIKGAAAIITQWPAQITSCWFTAITVAFIFILLTFVIFLATLNPLLAPVRPRCTRDIKNFHGNKIIHIVKHGIEWNSKQLDVLKFVAEIFPNFEINNIIVDISKNYLKREIKNITTATPITTMDTAIFYSAEKLSTHPDNVLLFPGISSVFFRKFNEIIAKDREMFKNNVRNFHRDFLLLPHFNSNTTESNFDIPKFTFLNYSLPSKKREKRSHQQNTYAEVLRKHGNIKEKKITYKEYFAHTPLEYYWPDLNSEMLILAIRVQELWQKGGISFALPNHDMENIHNKSAIFDMSRLKSVIVNTKYKYDLLPNENVCVDAQGMHMATRTPCHAFFGEMLMRMQRDSDKLTASNFITNVLDLFCKQGNHDFDYCKKIQNN